MRALINAGRADAADRQLDPSKFYRAWRLDERQTSNALALSTQAAADLWSGKKCCADRDSPVRAHRESPDPYPVSPKVPFAAVDPILAPVRARQERSDNYPCIARLNDRWRVIRCADDVQWILQRRKGVLWFGNSYHRDRAVLLQRIAERCGAVDAGALDVIRALPEWYEEGAP
jgi:hypothetical protein